MRDVNGHLLPTVLPGDHAETRQRAVPAVRGGRAAGRVPRLPALLPDAAPGSDWNYRADVVGRAMRLIADGVVDRDGVPGLAERFSATPNGTSAGC